MGSESLFIKCKTCGKDISKAAKACPQCGSKQKKLSLIHWIGIGFLGLIIIGIINSPENNNKSKSSSSSSVKAVPQAKVEKKTYNEGETVNAGYTSYAVWRSWWSSRLSSNEFLNQRPNSMYLFVDLTVKNDDKKARTIPPFKLVDENGAEYEASSGCWAVEGSIGIIETLNPSVSKQGFVVFDVPKGRKYRMKLSGGYWSTEDAYVQLSPKESR